MVARPMPRLRFDLLDQHPAEDVAPAIVVADAYAGAMRRARKPPACPARRPARSPTDRCRRKRSNASATVSRSSAANGIRCPAAKSQDLRPSRFRRKRQNGRTIAHQSVIRLARAIPLDHGEFRVVQRAALAVAEDLGEFDDPPLARRQELLAGKFRRGAQIEPARSAVRRPSASVAKACRWVSLPGETCNAPVSTSTKSSAAK